MQYVVWKDHFTKIAETKGILQNASKTVTIEVSNSQTPGSGVLLKPGGVIVFNGDVYVRCSDGKGSEVRVGTFVPTNGAGGGGGGNANIEVATEQQVKEILDRYFPQQ